jgi:hypothetical protein
LEVEIKPGCHLSLFLGLALLLTSLLVACEPVPSLSENLALNALNTEEVLSHAGEVKIVEGIILGGYYAESLKGQPTFLDFHKPHEGYFEAIIWRDDKDKFPPNPETYFLNKKMLKAKRSDWKKILRIRMNMDACLDMYGWTIKWLTLSLSGWAMPILIPFTRTSDIRSTSFNWRKRRGSRDEDCGLFQRKWPLRSDTKQP